MVTGDPVDLNLIMSPSSRKIPALLTKDSAQPCQIESCGELCGFGCARLMMMNFLLNASILPLLTPHTQRASFELCFFSFCSASHFRQDCKRKREERKWVPYLTMLWLGVVPP